MKSPEFSPRAALAVASAFIVAVSMTTGVVAVGATTGPTTAEPVTGTASGTTTSAGQGALANDLETIVADSDSSREAAFAAAERALASRQRLADDETAPLAVERTNLLGVQSILGIADGNGDAGSVDAAAELAEAGFKLQSAKRSDGDAPTAMSDVDLPDTATPTHASPSAAAFAILNRHGVTPTAEQTREIKALDALPEPTRSELTDLLDAYLGYERTTQAAYDGVERPSLRSPSTGDATAGAGAHTAGVDVDRVRAAQLRLVLASSNLRSSLASANVTKIRNPRANAPVDGVDVPGVLSIDLSRSDNTYSTNYTVQIDAGGDDVYNNNAGGAEGAGAPPANDPNPDAAALIDLAGDDAYHGRNGGGDDVAVGFLVDAGTGNDDYNAHSGDFDPDGHGVNGGGNVASIGFLLDTAGEDNYRAGDNGTNGGAQNVAAGFLLDTGRGNDSYKAGDGGTNGGARGAARGFLLDTAGSDTYSADDMGTNGGARDGGIGVLLDTGQGDDTYRAGSSGTNGAGGFDSIGGFLLDAGGADRYQAGDGGTNGGAVTNGVGLLVDAGAGDDTFTAGNIATNGGGALSEGGFLVNTGPGDDTYVAGDGGTNGGGFVIGPGFLLDSGQGDDTYEAGNQGTNGGATFIASGFLLDTAGDEVYEGGHTGTNGGARLTTFGGQTWPSRASLVDAAGTDSYNDTNVTCTDCSRIPKGTIGAQVDSDDPTGKTASSESDTETGSRDGIV